MRPSKLLAAAVLSLFLAGQAMASFFGPDAGDFFTSVSLGRIAGHTAVFLISRNSGVPTTFETLWPDSTVYSFAASAETMTVSSTDADDTSAGAGARTVRVTGLDSSYNEVVQDATMNGLTGVTLGTQLLRVNFVQVLTAGATGSNEGTIFVGSGTVTAGTPANKRGAIALGINKSQHGFYTVPNNKTLLIYDSFTSAAAGDDGTIRVSIRPAGGLFLSVSERQYTDSVATVPLSRPPFKVPEQSDIHIQGAASTGTDSLTVIFNCILVDD